MAGDSAITVKTLSNNAFSTLAPSAVYASSTGASVYLDLDTMDASRVLLLFSQTAGAAMSVTIKDGAEYSGGTLGDVTLVTTALGEYAFGPFESARFKDSDGYIKINGATTGDTSLCNIKAILLP